LLFRLPSFYIVYFRLSKWHRICRIALTFAVHKKALGEARNDRQVVRCFDDGNPFFDPSCERRFRARAVSSTQSYSSQVTLQAKHVSEDFTADANLDKRVWQKAQWAQFEKSISGKDEYPENRTRVRRLVGQIRLFRFHLQLRCLNVFEGEDISKERWSYGLVTWLSLPESATRAVLHYYEFEIAPNNQWVDLEITRGEKPNHDASWNSGFEHAVRVDAKHRVWNAEMRIPLSSMNAAGVKPGIEWRVNFFRAAEKAPIRNENSSHGVRFRRHNVSRSQPLWNPSSCQLAWLARPIPSADSVDVRPAW